MQPSNTVDVLNELLAMECTSELSRVGQSANFVSWPVVGKVEALNLLVSECNEHKSWLVDAIVRRGGAPSPSPLGIETAGHHFLDVQFVLPRVVADVDRLLAAYQRALSLIAGDSDASRLISRVVERYEMRLSQMRAAPRHAAPG